MAKRSNGTKKSKNKSLTKTTDSAVVSSDMQERMKTMAGAGLEKAESGDYKIPMLYLCQSNSSAYDKGSDSYIEGIEVGDLYDTVSRVVVGDDVRIIPCHFDVKAIEWVPIADGGGLVKIHDRSRLHDNDVEATGPKGKPGVNGNELVETAEWLVMAEVEEDRWKQFMIPMSSSGLRASSTLCTMIAEYRPEWWGNTEGHPPSYANTYRLSSVRKEKDGNAYRAYAVTVDEPTPENALPAAEKLFHLASTTDLATEGREQGGQSPDAGSRPAGRGDNRPDIEVDDVL